MGKGVGDDVTNGAGVTVCIGLGVAVTVLADVGAGEIDVLVGDTL